MHHSVFGICILGTVFKHFNQSALMGCYSCCWLSWIHLQVVCSYWFSFPFLNEKVSIRHVLL